MNTINSRRTLNRKQMGFFDFGLGLGLLALFGGTAVVVAPDADEKTIVVEQQIQSEPTEVPTEITVVQSSRDE